MRQNIANTLKVGQRVKHWLNQGAVHGRELRDAQAITQIDRDDSGNVRRVKLADSPCWISVKDLHRRMRKVKRERSKRAGK